MSNNSCIELNLRIIPIMSTSPSRSLFSTLNFDNRFTRELPADSLNTNSRRQVFGACYSRVQPTPVAAPQLIAHVLEVARILDISEETCHSPEFTKVFSGNLLLDGMDPFAMCYGGHQFGNWAGQLGDGRAINLGEVINSRGERWCLQLKGAGPTPYSRNADGLAVLRSSLREFLCSEAMFHLGIPTTRALSLVGTGERVERDMFYDGHPQEEPGAIVCRVAPSFLRFGNFQIHAVRNEHDLLRRLVDYTIRTDFPHLGEPSPEVYRQWFEEICRRTAETIVHWMRVGFVHGVMNTDNMSILGLTIDYGPYGWLENYDPAWTPNTTDAQGRRYCFGNQPQVAQWNLAQFANALVPLFAGLEPLQEALDVYRQQFLTQWRTMMAAKLGLPDYQPACDEKIINELLDLLCLIETDMTIFFRRLAEIDSDSSQQTANIDLLADACYRPEQYGDDYRLRLSSWLQKYRQRLATAGIPDKQRRALMNRTNPKYVLRNYLAQQAIDHAETGDYRMIDELLELLRKPYAEQPQNQKYFSKRPEWARHRAGCSMLSCSS
jgi:serine/tyrosine/threonine adenylyltransferase